MLTLTSSAVSRSCERAASDRPCRGFTLGRRERKTEIDRKREREMPKRSTGSQICLRVTYSIKAGYSKPPL